MSDQYDLPPDNYYRLVSERAAKTPASFLVGSFFDYTPESGKRYDIIYDYTWAEQAQIIHWNLLIDTINHVRFFCAIPPALRSAWGQKMSELTAQGGHLITLCYPIDGEREDGPPYSVHVDAYAQSLGPQWNKVVDKAPEVSTEPVGRERLVVWRRMWLCEP